MKKIFHPYLWIMIAALLALTALIYSADRIPAAAQRRGADPRPAAAQKRSTFDFGRYTGNKPFRLNTLPTTPFGPPWADIVTHPKKNMLECKVRTAPIALCYYSGPGGTTPCVLDGLGIANCTCYEIPAGETYYVDINAILNLDVYLQTVAKCGKNGDNCQPTGNQEAPVCDAINTNKLIPGADLISTFSLYLKDNNQMPISPTACPKGTYAGCMTAPCKRTGVTDPTTKLPLVQCGCPVYTGNYQVGGGISTDQCYIGGNYVWSAAYTPTPNP